MTATAAPVYFESTDASRESAVSVSTLHKYERQGLIRPLRTASGRRLYSPDDLEIVKALRRQRERQAVRAGGRDPQAA